MSNETITLKGNIARIDEIVRTAEDKKDYIRFAVAVNHEGDTPADFHDCVAFGEKAEEIANDFTKGQFVKLSGAVQKSMYNDKPQYRVATSSIEKIERKSEAVAPF